MRDSRRNSLEQDSGGYRVYRPTPRLAPFLESLWTRRMEGDSDTVVHDSLPSPWTDAVMILSGAASGPENHSRAFFERLAFCGANTAPRSTAMRRGDLVLGLRFRPGAALPFLGCPAEELTDRPVHAGELWGSAADGLEERIRGAGSAPGAIAVLQEALAARVSRWTGESDPDFSRLLEHLSSLAGRFSVREAADWAGVTPRQLQRKFLRRVGVGPKLFARMLRFQRAVELLRSGRRPDWLGAVCGAGYADRPHLAAEFRRFTARPPVHFLSSL